MEFRILGPLEVVDGERQVSLGGARQRAVLALLLTRANEIVSTERLIDQLWAEQPPKAAANTVQYYVSQLRKALGAERILTRAPGYLIEVEPGELDLDRFERLVEQGDADALREALSLWRGQALADVSYEPFAQAESHRLEELRLVALERRIEADIAVGRHAELIGELEQLVARQPLRERLRSLLMLALYRSGRQADALAAYHAARATLVEELGLEPSPALQELERAILRQDPALAPDEPVAVPERSILVAVQDEALLDNLVSLAEPLARKPPREVLLAEVVESPAALTGASALLHERRAELHARGVAARAAAFTSTEAAVDVVRLAAQQDVDLLLVDVSRSVVADGVFGSLVETLLADAPCDVALLLGGRRAPVLATDRPVLVPFGGAEHDWAAVEVAAWIAGAQGVALRLLGSAGRDGERDASRLLANASLLVQRVIGIPTEPVLVPRGAAGVISAAADAGLVVVGLSLRWREEGLGETRLAVARDAEPPTLLVRAGLRPGGLAPEQSITRFSWTLGPGT
ncbi:MAG TPA: BTAD domain-containing putative transcriptional regulator [Gaiellaceae bacterium]|jgi:DNA-binding SARP family transcriptional activator